MALGVYGTSVITAIAAQNTTGVTRVLETPATLVAPKSTPAWTTLVPGDGQVHR